MTAHQDATRKAAEARCLVCGTTPCEPCHFPVHRGMAGGKAGWEDHEWIPACRPHHDELDGRNGASAHATEQTRIVRYIVNVRAPDWWRG